MVTNSESHYNSAYEAAASAIETSYSVNHVLLQAQDLTSSVESRTVLLGAAHVLPVLSASSNGL